MVPLSRSNTPFPMNRFSLLESLLSAEQVEQLRLVQAGLEKDPTCLDRPSTESVPNCYNLDSPSEQSDEKCL